MKKAIVIGASSGIGKELALILAMNGYEVGLMARRIGLLEVLQKEIPTKSYIEHLDLSQASNAMEKMEEMMQKMGKIDLIIINAGTGFINPDLDWSKEQQTLDVNVYGFCALSGLAFKFFSKQGYGHLVGISSIGALRGNSIAPAYNASKAFMSNYLEGLWKKAALENNSIIITDIQPGSVNTDMMKGEGHFWIASPQKAAEQIFSAIQKHKKHAYVTKRWRLIGWLFKLMPNWLYKIT